MTDNISDEEIIKKITKGEKELFSIIIDRYEKKLFGYAVNLLKDKEKATDVLQDSFIKTYINLNSFDTNKKFSSWIYRIVHNETINLIKKYQKEIKIPENFDIKSEEDIENNFQINEIKEKIKENLNKIPIIYSEPLELFFFEEKTYEEISDILRIPMGTVATRINRGKILMKKICKQN